MLVLIGIKMMAHAWLKEMMGRHFNLFVLAAVILILAAGVMASLAAANRDAMES